MRYIFLFLFTTLAFCDLLEESIINANIAQNDEIERFNAKFASNGEDLIFHQSLSKDKDEENLNIDFNAFLDKNFFVVNTINLNKKYYNQSYYLGTQDLKQTMTFDNYYLGFNSEDGSSVLIGHQPLDVFFSSSHVANGLSLKNSIFDNFNFGLFAFDEIVNGSLKGDLIGVLASYDTEILSANSSFARFGSIGDILVVDLLAKHDIAAFSLMARSNFSASLPNEFYKVSNELENSNFMAFELGLENKNFQTSLGYLNYGKKDAKSFYSIDKNGHFITAGSELLDYFSISGKNQAYFAKARLKGGNYSIGLDYVNQIITNTNEPKIKNHEITASAGFMPTKRLYLNFLYSLSYKNEPKNKEKKDKIQLDASYKF